MSVEDEVKPEWVFPNDRRAFHADWSDWTGPFLLGLCLMVLLLGIVALPNYLRGQAQGRLTSCNQCLGDIGTALDM